MTLAVGDPFPRMEFRLQGQAWKPTPGSSGLLMYFMRTADCPVCRAHVKRLISLAPSFNQKGFAVVVVVPDGESESSVSRSLQTPFPVVQGVGAHGAMGLTRKLLSLVQQSGTVIHDAKGLVLHTRVATSPTSAFDEDAVIDLIAGPRAGIAPMTELKVGR